MVHDFLRNGVLCGAVRRAVKGVLSDAWALVRQENVLQTKAAVKRMISDFSDALRNNNAFECGTSFKGVISDFGDAVWNCDGSEAGAVLKRPFSDSGNAVRNHGSRFIRSGVAFEQNPFFDRKFHNIPLSFNTSVHKYALVCIIIVIISQIRHIVKENAS